MDEFQTFFSIVKESSRICVAHQFPGKKVVLKPATTVPDLDPNQSLRTRMILTGHGNFIRLIYVFKREDSLSLLSSRMGKTVETLSQTDASDFMRELLNLYAGALRSILNQVGLRFWSNLPMVLSGTDTQTGDDDESHFCCWTIGIADVELYCVATVKLTNVEDLTKHESVLQKILADNLAQYVIKSDIEIF